MYAYSLSPSLSLSLSASPSLSVGWQRDQIFFFCQLHQKNICDACEIIASFSGSRKGPAEIFRSRERDENGLGLTGGSAKERDGGRGKERRE